MDGLGTVVVAGLVAGTVVAGTSPWWVAERAVVTRAKSLRSAAGEVRGMWGHRGGGASDNPADLGVILELLGAALRSGASLPRSFEAVGRALGGHDGARLAEVATVLVDGGTWDDAWSRGPDVRGPFGVVAESLRAAWDHGAAPADALRVAQSEARREASAGARTAAGRLGVHLVLPLGTCYLPAFVLVGVVPVLISLGAGVLG